MIFQPAIPWWVAIACCLPVVAFSAYVLVQKWQYAAQRWTWLRRMAISLLCLFIALRPAIPGGTSPGSSALLDVYFIIDTTMSSTAEDYNGANKRIDGMRDDVKAITRQLTGARFGVIAFDSVANLTLPLTRDTSAVISAMDTLQTQRDIDAIGSAIDKPVELATKELQRIKQAEPQRKRLLFYLGDGEQTLKKDVGSFDSLKPLIDGGAVLGYGTSAGGKMFDAYAAKHGYGKYMKDTSSQDTPYPDALSKIDEDNLRAIASQAGIGYFHRSKPDNIPAVLQQGEVDKVIESSKEIHTYDDIYWLLAIIILALISWDFIRIRQELYSLKRVGRRKETR